MQMFEHVSFFDSDFTLSIKYNLIRTKKTYTFLKFSSPSLIKGVLWNIRSGDIVKEPFVRVYKLLIIRKRSEVFLTGKNLDLGTLIPRHFSKHFIAAPTAVSSWMTFTPPSRVLGLTMISISSVLSSTKKLLWKCNYFGYKY